MSNKKENQWSPFKSEREAEKWFIDKSIQNTNFAQGVIINSFVACNFARLREQEIVHGLDGHLVAAINLLKKDSINKEIMEHISNCREKVLNTPFRTDYNELD